MIKSHSLIFNDFKTQWYKKWAKALKQDKNNLGDYELLSNKFWQNAILFQSLWERGVVKKGSRALGFGVGQERLPALFAKYGVEVTATDQDFKTAKAGYWAEHELATGVQSLNQLGICEKKVFTEAVEYMPVDMNEIPKKLHNTYDLLWSNCALGHLGSIPAGLSFIEESLKCLKPGGWAVHTTELNILSNSSTVEMGSTVIFRLKDIYNLQLSLLNLGYVSEPFKLIFGNNEFDRRINMRPEYGNDYSKIQVMGHLATQILLIIQKPTKLSKAKKMSTKLLLHKAYIENIAKLNAYRRSDAVIAPILKSQIQSHTNIQVTPVKNLIKVTIEKGKTKEMFINYSNTSSIPIFGSFYRLGDSKPIVLATSEPYDRNSSFASSDWQEGSKNRAATDLWLIENVNKSKNLGHVLANYIEPAQDFAFKLSLSATHVKKGAYTEHFSLVQEGAAWIKNSVVTVEIKVV